MSKPFKLKKEYEWEELLEENPALAKILAENADLSKMECKEKNGVLTVTIPSHVILNTGTMAFGIVEDKKK